MCRNFGIVFACILSLLASSWLSAQSLPSGSSSDAKVVLSQAQYQELKNLLAEYKQTAESLRAELTEQKKTEVLLREQLSTAETQQNNSLQALIGLSDPLTTLKNSTTDLTDYLQKSTNQTLFLEKNQSSLETGLLATGSFAALELVYILLPAFAGVP